MAVRHNLQNALGAEGIIIFCRACIHSRRFPPHQALKLWGGEATFPQIAARNRCKCGAKAWKAEPYWPRRSRGGSKPQAIIPKEWGRLP